MEKEHINDLGSILVCMSFGYISFNFSKSHWFSHQRIGRGAICLVPVYFVLINLKCNCFCSGWWVVYKGIDDRELRGKKRERRCRWKEGEGGKEGRGWRKEENKVVFANRSLWDSVKANSDFELEDSELSWAPSNPNSKKRHTIPKHPLRRGSLWWF